MKSGYSDKSREAALEYLLVIQGCNGTIRSRLLVRWDLEATDAEMLYESANGYSVVLSGALMKSDWMKRAH